MIPGQAGRVPAFRVACPIPGSLGRKKFDECPSASPALHPLSQASERGKLLPILYRKVEIFKETASLLGQETP